MNNQATASDNSPRSVLSLPATREFVSPQEIQIVSELMRDREVDLTQPPVERLLQVVAQNEKEWRGAHIDIAVAGYKEFFATISNEEIDTRETSFSKMLKPEDNRGHYFYRYFLGRCKFARSKSTKMATYLQARVQDGMYPDELRVMMMDNWKLEDGYNHALEELNGSSTRKEKKKPLSAEHADDTDDKHRKKSTKRPPITMVGFPGELDEPRKSFAIVYLSLKRNVRRVEFLSPEEVIEMASEFLAGDEDVVPRFVKKQLFSKKGPRPGIGYGPFFLPPATSPGFSRKW